MRIGNAATEQFQLDVCGEILDGLHLARDTPRMSTDETAWDMQCALLDHLEGHWDQPDNGLWEMRGSRQQFVHSKVMAWAGADRAVRTVENHDLDGPVDKWRMLRDEIHAERLSPTATTRTGGPSPSTTARRALTPRCC